MDFIVNASAEYAGNIILPPSKSDSQRAILVAGLAHGSSLLKNVGPCNDEQQMLQSIQKIGAVVEKISEKDFRITGTSKIPERCSVNIGESGLAARLFSGIFACSDGAQEIVGEGSVLKRKMDFYFSHEEELHFSPIGNATHTLPLLFDGKISTKNYIVNGGESSQDISGLLYGLCLDGNTHEIQVVHLKSRPYVQMTLNTLKKFGITISTTDFEHFSIPKNNRLQATVYAIEGDWSSAGFWLVASALGKEIAVENVQLSSLQADKNLLNILTASKCVILRSHFLQIDGKNRTPVTADLTNCPDLFPALTTYAALTPGISRLTGIHRLHNKESDRSAVLMEEFGKLGVHTSIENDDLVIEGKEKISGGIVDSHNDHRIAMALAIAGMFATSDVKIINAEAVDKSYPNFWRDLTAVQQFTE